MATLTVEQANALLVVEPFVIVQVTLDEEGYQHADFEPVLLATNFAIEPKELNRLVRVEVMEIEDDSLTSCFVTYLFNLTWAAESYPQEGAYLEATEVVVLATEPLVLDTEGVN